MSKIYLGLGAYLGQYQWKFTGIDEAISQGIDPTSEPSLVISNIPANASLIFGSYISSAAPSGYIIPILGENGFMMSKGNSVYSSCSNIRIKNQSTTAIYIRTTWNDSGIELVGYNYNGNRSTAHGCPYGTNAPPNSYAYGVFYFFA